MSEYARTLAQEDNGIRMEQLTIELPETGAVSWQNIERCARDAHMSVDAWVFDAIAAYVRMHEDAVRMAQAEAWPRDVPERAPVPAWRLWVAERAYRLADRLTEPHDSE